LAIAVAATATALSMTTGYAGVELTRNAGALRGPNTAQVAQADTARGRRSEPSLSEDAVVRTVKNRVPGARILKLTRVSRGGGSAFEVRLLTPEGKVRTMVLGPSELRK
jgi:hypothetical protein